jgi:N-glycosylase/DNA lyase
MKRKIEFEVSAVRGRDALIIRNLGDMDIKDTLECGQAFRYEELIREEAYVEYLTVAMGRLIFIGQRKRGEVIFYGMNEGDIPMLTEYFTLDLDYTAVREMISAATDSEWMMRAADCSRGIHILKQDAWEALFSFIISQNNNIPRIRKIIRKLAVEYGENLAIKEGLRVCPKGLCQGVDDSVCRGCGICYSFPTAEAVVNEPERMLTANPGFRYKYLLDAATRVHNGESDLGAIERAEGFEIIMEELKKILGVGDKVASCVALFGMGRLEAFPIDVWMKRAIDEYFDGVLDYKKFGDYAGVAQQYIFHYIRNTREK